MSVRVKRTATDDEDFQLLVAQLDQELWNELIEDEATYDPLNKVPDIKTAILVYENKQAAACGCFKPFSDDTIEIKRMFVNKENRGRGLSKIVLQNLEAWAMELGFKKAVLETSIYLKTAHKLYYASGYQIIPNYPPYEKMEESICMAKNLTP